MLVYDILVDLRCGKVVLVLGVGNIVLISFFDVFYKLFVENEVVVLKFNLINDYLEDYLWVVLKLFIDKNVLCIFMGGGVIGVYFVEY